MKFSIDKKNKTIYILDKDTIDYLVKEKFLEEASDLSCVAVAFYEAATNDTIPDEEVYEWSLGTNSKELLDYLQSVLADPDKVDIVMIDN